MELKNFTALGLGLPSARNFQALTRMETFSWSSPVTSSSAASKRATCCQWLQIRFTDVNVTCSFIPGYLVEAMLFCAGAPWSRLRGCLAVCQRLEKNTQRLSSERNSMRN